MSVFSSHLLQYEDLGIGNRLRVARQDRGLTLKDLAARVGISVARLSEIETGQHILDIEQAITLSRALEIRPTTLLPADVPIPYAIDHERTVRSRLPHRPRLTSAGDGGVLHRHDFWPLADLFIGRHLEPMLGRIFPEVPEDRRLYSHHEEEFLFVLTGQVALTCQTPAGLYHEELGRGDCICFRSDLPHRLTSTTSDPAETLHVFASTSAPIETGVDRHALVQRTLLVEEGEWAPTKLMGARLLALREAHGWSLEQVASAAGVPARHLRRIEDGRKQAPLDAVLKLARAFGKPVGELTGETLEQGPWYFVQRSAEIASVPNRLRRTPVDVSSAPPSKTCQRLAGGFPTKHMYPYFVRLLNVNIDSLTLHEHHGHEFLYVLEGEVELRTYAGDQPVTEILRPGDCCYLDSTVPHLVHAQSRNPYSETAAEVLDIFWTPLGERYLFAEEVLQGSQA